MDVRWKQNTGTDHVDILYITQDKCIIYTHRNELFFYILNLRPGPHLRNISEEL